MAKKSFHISLSDAALAELERRAGGRDKRQAYIERWLTEPELQRRQTRAVIPDNGLREALAERKRLYPDAPNEIVIGNTSVESWRSGPIPKPGQKGKK